MAFDIAGGQGYDAPGGAGLTANDLAATEQAAGEELAAPPPGASLEEVRGTSRGVQRCTTDAAIEMDPVSLAA